MEHDCCSHIISNILLQKHKPERKGQKIKRNICEILSTSFILPVIFCQIFITANKTGYSQENGINGQDGRE